MTEFRHVAEDEGDRECTLGIHVLREGLERSQLLPSSIRFRLGKVVCRGLRRTAPRGMVPHVFIVLVLHQGFRMHEGKGELRDHTEGWIVLRKIQDFHEHREIVSAGVIQTLRICEESPAMVREVVFRTVDLVLVFLEILDPPEDFEFLATVVQTLPEFRFHPLEFLQTLVRVEVCREGRRFQVRFRIFLLLMWLGMVIRRTLLLLLLWLAVVFVVLAVEEELTLVLHDLLLDLHLLRLVVLLLSGEMLD